MAHLLAEADIACGGDGSASVMWAGLVLQQFGHRSLEALIVALRDGMTSGKIYGRLAYPQVSEWLNAHEEKVMGMAQDGHSVTKFVDNGGRDYLDALERKDPARRLEQKDRLIEQLRRKLDTKQP